MWAKGKSLAVLSRQDSVINIGENRRRKVFAIDTGGTVINQVPPRRRQIRIHP